MTNLRQEYEPPRRIPSQMRRDRFRQDLQKEAAAAFAVVGSAVLVLVSLLPFTLSLPLLVASAAFGGSALVALFQLRGYHPHSRFGTANAITLVRLGGASVFAAFAAEPAILSGPSAWLALAAALLLLALDGVDGWIARRERLASAFGARFDMEVDALLILILAVLAVVRGDAAPWALGLGLIRYAFVIAGWVFPFLTRPLPASFRRKFVCVLQIIVLTALLAPAVDPPLSNLLAALAFASLLWSFAVDVRWLLARRSA